MKTIARRTPKSSVTLHKALWKGAQMENALTPAQRFLPPAFSTKLINTSANYNTLVKAAINAEGNYKNNNHKLKRAVASLRTYCNHFIQVLNFAIVRGDEGFSEGDRHYYQLTDGNVPNLVSEANVFFWADNLLKGEANRLAAKPGAPAMSNPSATKLAALKATADDHLAKENQLATIQSEARAQVNKAFKNGVLVVTQLWNFVENNYLHQSDESRREIMREWGVVFITIGTPTQLTGVVKNEAGEPLPQAVVTLDETGADTKTNADGRYTLPTKFSGSGNLIFKFPGKENVNLSFNISDEAEGNVLNLPDVVMGG